jgi:hypothetical protein
VEARRPSGKEALRERPTTDHWFSETCAVRPISSLTKKTRDRVYLPNAASGWSRYKKKEKKGKERKMKPNRVGEGADAVRGSQTLRSSER